VAEYFAVCENIGMQSAFDAIKKVDNNMREKQITLLRSDWRVTG